MGDRIITSFEGLAKDLNDILMKAHRKNAKMIEQTVADLPRRFEQAAIDHYPSVLKRRSGNLVRAIRGFSSRSGKNVIAGLRNAMKYARIQEYGGTTSAHVIVPRRKKALSWPGAKHPVRRVKHPGSRIRAKHFLRDPLRIEGEDLFAEIKQEFGF